MLSKVYSFLDWDGWSGERVVLRPDGTIPVARLYIDNLSGQQLARLFYVTNIFAFEGTGKENRERWQCGAEFFGGVGAAADVEVILLAEEVLRKLGISGVELKLSHAGLLRALVKELKLSPGEETRMISRIFDGDWQALSKAQSANPGTERLIAALLSLKGKSSGFLRNIRASFPKASPDFKSSLKDFVNVAALLDDQGCRYEIDIAAMRGFEYYTGICFQFLTGTEKIGGGGRYDNLVPLMSGGDVRACGFALYLDPIMRLLPPDERKNGRSSILIKADGARSEASKACFAVAESLRNAGYTVELGFPGQRVSGYRWVVFVSGEAKPRFVLKDCAQRRQQKVASVAEILEAVGKE